MKKDIQTNELASLISGLYGETLAPKDAIEAAHSLTGLFEVLLEIQQDAGGSHA